MDVEIEEELEDCPRMVVRLEVLEGSSWFVTPPLLHLHLLLSPAPAPTLPLWEEWGG